MTTAHGAADYEGPFFDQLSVGQVFDAGPAVTLTEGRAAVHQSIVGSRLRLPLDGHLSRAVSGEPVADPGYVWDTAIGQSTQATGRVIANLFYRGLVFHRLPAIGDTLHTRTEVVGLRQNASRPTGMAALRVTTRDQNDRVVLDFWRCAMLPLSAPDVQTGHTDDLGSIGGPIDVRPLADLISGWSFDAFPPTGTGRATAGATWDLRAGDVVSSAPELARLTLNLAHIHHDRFAAGGQRLVYGGHTIGLALNQITRTLPDLVTVAGWHSCDHTGPVREGDTLTSTVTVENVTQVGDALTALTIRSIVAARRDDASHPVLDWRLVAFSR